MKTATVRLVSASFGLAAMAIVHAGCDNRHLIGGFDGGGGDAPTTSTDGGAAPDGRTNGQDGAIIAENWTGYIENYMFRSGSDAIRFSFITDAGGQVSGYVWFGNGTPPPPPSDPNVGYPADLLSASFDINLAPRSYLAEGYAYQMRAATVVGARLRFTVDTFEIWRDWCVLQIPAGTSGTCLPNAGTMISGDRKSCGLLDAATNQFVPVDCGKLALCSFGGVCMCGASGCAVREGSSGITFDLTFANLLASGSTGGQLGEHNVHFTKDP